MVSEGNSALEQTLCNSAAKTKYTPGSDIKKTVAVWKYKQNWKTKELGWLHRKSTDYMLD